MPTTNLGLPTITGNMTADVVRDMNALAEEVDLKVASKQILTTHLVDNTNHVKYAADTGTADAKVITINPAPTSYLEGTAIAFKNATQNTGAATININGLGAKPILKSNGNPLTSGGLKANSIYTVRYNGTSFILQGEGGEYGTATPGDVLAGVTLGTESGVVNGSLALTGSASEDSVLVGQTFYSTNAKSKRTGTMPYLAGVYTGIGVPANGVLKPSAFEYDVLPPSNGYYSTSSRIQQIFTNLVPSNIRAGVTIPEIGLTGTLTPGSAFTATPGDVVLVESAELRVNTSPTFTKLKDIKINFSGVVRVKFDLRSSNSANVEAVVYKNGVQVGTVRLVWVGTFTTFTEDFAVNAGDNIQLYARGQVNGNGSTVQNFKICVAQDPLSTIILA